VNVGSWGGGSASLNPSLKPTELLCVATGLDEESRTLPSDGKLVLEYSGPSCGALLLATPPK
jgi:hypothetical protein